MSLRLRLLIATGVAVLCGLLVVDVVTYVLVTRSQLGQVDLALQQAHTPVEALAAGDPSGWPLIPQIAPGLYVAIVDQSGTPLFTQAGREAGDHSFAVDLNGIDPRHRAQTVTSRGEDDMRIRSDRMVGGSTLVIGQSLHEIGESQRRLLSFLLIASAGAIATVLGLAWWLIRVGLRPLRAVEASAADITDSDLANTRVPGAGGATEVGRLALALNAMLDRLDAARAEREANVLALQESEARMRQFVADASHELRTPMAATAAYAELFESGARDRPADLQRSMSGIRTETARMAELVNDLLLLARLDEHRPLASEPVDLTEVVLASLETARALEADRRWLPKITEVISVTGDPARLRQVVDNLLTNVRTHTPRDAPCEVALTATRSEALLTIADSGPGVTDDQLERLGDRFFRVDGARTRASGGSGLGLSIAAAIVEAHGGTTEYSKRTPHGLVVTVRLPTEAPEAEPTNGDGTS